MIFFLIFPWICDKSLDISGFILGKLVNLKLSKTTHFKHLLM